MCHQKYPYSWPADGIKWVNLYLTPLCYQATWQQPSQQLRKSRFEHFDLLKLARSGDSVTLLFGDLRGKTIFRCSIAVVLRSARQVVWCWYLLFISIIVLFCRIAALKISLILVCEDWCHALTPVSIFCFCFDFSFSLLPSLTHSLTDHTVLL